jgi:hypothetical protein
MTGSGLAQLIIPITGTLFLTAWLALAFYLTHRPERPDGNPAPGHVIQVPAPAGSQEGLHAGPVERADLRTIAGVKR